MASSSFLFQPSPLLLKPTSTSTKLWTFTSFFALLRKKNKPFSQFNAVYSPGLSLSSPTNSKSSPRRGKYETEQDSISVLNERIRRDYSKREATRPVMDSEEADKYIRLVKEQQQIGLQKLKSKKAGDGGGNGDGDGSGGFSYEVDPYGLRSGDYVVHKKVGIGRFVGIKFDVPKGSSEPIEYVFIEYSDGMAKLPVEQASRMLYRYNLLNETKKPRTLSKLNDTGVWERRKTKGKVAIQKMVVDLMELYLHRLKQTRPPYPKNPAMADFAAQFPYEPTPDQKQSQSCLESVG